MPRVPVVGRVVDASVDLAMTAGRRALVITGDAAAAIAREVVSILATETDLTALITSVDLNRVLAGIDLDAVLARVDVNALVTRLDVEALMARIDLDAIVDRIDLDAIVDRIDLDAIVDRIDLDAIVDRIDLDRAVGRMDLNGVVHSVDLIAVANEVIDGVDLPGIVRDASTSVTADVMTDVRSTGERADDAIANAIGRLLGRAPTPRRDADEHGNDDGANNV